MRQSVPGFQGSPGVRKRSEDPGLAYLVDLASTEAQSGVLHLAGEPVYDHRITATVDGILKLGYHASQPIGGETALEDGKLHALPVPLTDLGDASEPSRSGPFGVGDIVGDQDVHATARRRAGRPADRREGDGPGGWPAPMAKPTCLCVDPGWNERSPLPCGPPMP